MASPRVNVLVYNGTGAAKTSVKHAIFSLTQLLFPRYAVFTIDDHVLLKEPWQRTCALLVFPGGGDLGYCRALNGPGNRIIRQFVRDGGAYLGFCAGGYYGGRACEFEKGNQELEVVGPRELRFFDGVCRGGAFRGFCYDSERGARAVRLHVVQKAFLSTQLSGIAVPRQVLSYYNGGGVFVEGGIDGRSAKEFDESYEVETLATYADDLDVDGGQLRSAIVHCRCGQGSVILSGPHVEFAPANLQPQPEVAGYDKLLSEIAEGDRDRVSFLGALLDKLGLNAAQTGSPVPSLTVLHLSSRDRPQGVVDLVDAWRGIVERTGDEQYIHAELDTFQILESEDKALTRSITDALSAATNTSSSGPELSESNDDVGLLEFGSIIKRILPHANQWPSYDDTPLFNHSTYYQSLQRYWNAEEPSRAWEFGKNLLYGEVLTSTNSILEKNHKLLSHLPTGFTVVASQQVAGRGRGNNVWVSPVGALIMSTVIQHPSSLAMKAPIIFIQYLTAIAIAEAIKSYDEGYENVPVRLKWPNDIYAQASTASAAGQPQYAKIGGILTNCSYQDGSYQVVVGIGINVSNQSPTISLNDIRPAGTAPIVVEKLTARILQRLETLYAEFQQDGFTRAMEFKYYRHWLHNGQVVMLEMHENKRARIVGITTDFGMLKADELDENDHVVGQIRLQSDENSFDFFRGLLKRKL